MAYIDSHRKMGMSPGSIRTRVSVLKYVSANPKDEGVTVDRIRCAAILAQVDREAANKKFNRKPNLPLSDLVRPLVPTGVTQRDRRFQALWWLCIVTGARPCHIAQAEIRYSSVGLRIRWGARKRQTNAMQRPLLYKFSWTCTVHADIIAELEGCKKIGTVKNTQSNIAACINSWVKKRLHVFYPGERNMTSTFPRVHLDNILREKLRNGEITEYEFSVLMEHTLKTSDEHYCDYLEDKVLDSHS